MGAVLPRTPTPRKRFERLKGARNAPLRTPQHHTPGRALRTTLRQKPRRVRPFPAAAGASPRPPLAPWMRPYPAPRTA